MKNIRCVGMLLAMCAMTVQARETVDLMGAWALKPSDAASFAEPPAPPSEISEHPDGDGWRLFQAPGAFDAGEQGGAWLTREFTLPGDLGQRVVLLKFDSVVFGHRVFVNGQDCGFGFGGYAPTEFDITKAARPGVNRLHLAVSSCSANPGARVWPMDGYRSQQALWGNKGQLIGLWQRARVEVAPAVYVADVYVRTSVSNMTLAAEVELVNTTDAEQTGMLRIAAHEEEKHGSRMPGRETRAWPAVELTLKPGERRVVSAGGAWPNARLWWPHDPHLYMLKMEWSPKSLPADVAFERFGFREYTVDGIHLKLNGRKLVIRGAAITRYHRIFRSKEEARRELDGHASFWNANGARLHCDPMEQYMLDAADEKGFFLVMQPPNAAGASGESRREVWASDDDQWLRYMKLSRNHPSIAIWSICNEGTFWGGGGEAAPSLPFLIERGKKMRCVAADALITSSHDTPLYRRGVLDFFDASTGWCAETDNFHPRQCRLWQSYFYKPVNEYKKDKPWVDDEWGHANSIHAGANFIGERSYIHRDNAPDGRNYWQTMGDAIGLWMAMIEHRRQPYFCTVLALGDLYSYCDIETGKYVADQDMMKWANQAWAAQAVFPKEYYGGAWAGAGETYRRALIVMNDVFTDLKGALRWRVTDADGRVLDRGELRLNVPSATHQEAIVTSKLPALPRPTAAKLHYDLLDSTGRVVFADAHEFGILPRPDWKSVKPVVVWPAAGSLARLKKPPFRWTIQPTLPDTATVVVVPRGAEIAPHQWNELEQWLGKGGCALVLADTGLPVTFGGTQTRTSGKAAVIAHVRASDHPIVQDMPEAALRYWMGAAGDVYSPPLETNMPDMSVASRALRKPLSGNFLTLLDSSLGAVYLNEPDPGLSQAPMFEVRYEKGRAILCTMLLAEGMALDIPAASWLMRESLVYLQDSSRHIGEAPRPAVVAGIQAPRLRIATTKNLQSASAYLINASNPEGEHAFSSTPWLEYARNGGKVLLHNLAEDQIRHITDRLGITFTTREFNSNPHDGQTIAYRLDLVKAHPLLRGISHFEVNWNETGHFVSRFLSRQPILKLGVFSDDPRVENLTKQGALLVIRVGKGMVVIDQVLWDPEKFVSDYARRRADSYISALLSNLGVAAVPRPSITGSGFEQPNANTIMLYHFESEGTGLVTDEGDRGYDLLLNDKVELVEGKVGHALRLNPGSAVYPELFQATFGSQTPEMTIRFWIKPETDPNPEGQGAGDILRWARGAANESRDVAVFLAPDGTIGAGLGGGGFSGGTGKTRVWKKHEWAHVTVTFSAANRRIRIYVNGEKDAEWTPHISYYPYGAFQIGNTGRDGKNSFVGLVDELHVWAGEWTPELESSDRKE